MIADTDDATFPRSARLLTPAQFKATFSQGRRISAALFRLHMHQGGSESSCARMGISVSKRVAANAVERNRIKRIARDSFRRQRMQLRPGDYVLLAQREAAGAPSAALRAALALLWQKTVMLKTAQSIPTTSSYKPDSATTDPC